MAENIAKAVREHGGVAYYVGGYIRDKLRGIENKDIDIEVHGIYPRQLEEILDDLGERVSVGESFGIYRLKGCDLDIAMPRKETNRGSGHKDFDVCVDPFIGVKKAASRRDFTVNAILEDILTGEIIDPFGGAGDIEKGIIRHVNDGTFAEDPLRVLRAAQFAARFGFTVAAETTELCKNADLSFLSKERVEGELKKALLKSGKPSVFFTVLREMHQLSVWFPELEQTIGVGQNPEYHAEGDVWTHTLMVVDVAAQYREQAKNPFGFMLAAVAHDFGKAVCTSTVNGGLHAYGHEIEGIPLVISFMKRLTAEKALIRYVVNLCEQHMMPNKLAADKSSVKSTNKMFDASLDPEALLNLALADGLGKISSHEYISYDDFLAERLAVYKEYMSRPYVTGRDLIEAGIKPSKNFSEYLAFAHKLRLAGIPKEDALKQTLALARGKGELPKR